MGTSYLEQRRRTRLLRTLFQGLYQLHTQFISNCMLRRFQSLGIIGNLIYRLWKILLGAEECSTTFLLLWHLQLAEACKWRRKVYYVGKHRLPKKFTIINSLFTISWYLPHPVWEWMRLHVHWRSGQHRIKAKECSKPSIYRHNIFKRCFSGVQLGIL